MGVRDAILYALDKTRAVTGPAYVDIRPTSISVITRVWSEGQRGAGYSTDTTLTLPSFVKIRHVTQREIAASGGLYEMGDVIVGAITPRYTAPDASTGGFTELQVAPSTVGAGLPEGTEIIYRLAQQSGATGIVGDYALVQFRRDRTYRFELVIRRRQDTP